MNVCSCNSNCVQLPFANVITLNQAKLTRLGSLLNYFHLSLDYDLIDDANNLPDLRKKTLIA